MQRWSHRPRALDTNQAGRRVKLLATVGPSVRRSCGDVAIRQHRVWPCSVWIPLSPVAGELPRKCACSRCETFASARRVKTRHATGHERLLKHAPPRSVWPRLCPNAQRHFLIWSCRSVGGVALPLVARLRHGAAFDQYG